jgi:hypothetical protein
MNFARLQGIGVFEGVAVFGMGVLEGWGVSTSPGSGVWVLAGGSPSVGCAFARSSAATVSATDVWIREVPSDEEEVSLGILQAASSRISRLVVRAQKIFFIVVLSFGEW